MKTFHKEFYATRQDLLPGLQRLESEANLQYVLRGMFSTPSPVVYFSALDIPDLGIARYGQGEDLYLVTKAGMEIAVEEVPQEKGGVLYNIGLLENPTAFGFQPGGQFGEKTIIVGTVGTATGDSMSLAQCKWFWHGLSKGFANIKGCFIGPEANQFLDEGWRLTEASQSPSKFDFCK